MKPSAAKLLELCRYHSKKANHFRLTLNMKFSELLDPKKIASDVTSKKRCGNGDKARNRAFFDQLGLPTN